MILTALGSADAWRLVAAGVSLFVLFSLAIALVAFGEELLKPWRRVLILVATQQLVIAYAAVVRAKSTPAGLPDGAVDVPLVAIVLSGIGLALTVLGVFSGRRPKRGE